MLQSDCVISISVLFPTNIPISLTEDVSTIVSTNIQIKNVKIRLAVYLIHFNNTNKVVIGIDFRSI